MLNLKFIRDNREFIIERLKIKNFDAREIIDQIITLYNKRGNIQQEIDQKQNELKLLSKNIGKLFKEGKAKEANEAKQKTPELKESIKEASQKMAAVEMELDEFIIQVPNIPHDSVPAGTSENDNILIREGGDIPELKNTPLAHWDLGKKYDILNFDLGNKITGTGFPLFKAKGAALQRALINYFLDEAGKEGFTEYLPPLMVNESSAFATGQLPDKEGQMYQLKDENFYLIPTAEVPVTNIFRDTILKEEDLPVKLTAYTPCFRREAGSYGKDVRGLNRVHQFDKVEIVIVEHPEKSYETLDYMVKHTERLICSLGLPYRILRLCGGDLSFTSALTYDF